MHLKGQDLGSGFYCSVLSGAGAPLVGEGWGFAVGDAAVPARAANTGRVVLEQGSRVWFSRVLTGLARQWWRWWGSPLCTRVTHAPSGFNASGSDRGTLWQLSSLCNPLQPSEVWVTHSSKGWLCGVRLFSRELQFYSVASVFWVISTRLFRLVMLMLSVNSRGVWLKGR